MAFNLDQIQSDLRIALAAGIVPPDQEVGSRGRIADLLIREYDQGLHRGNTQYLKDAIEHTEAILRRLPQDSAQRPENLNRLSYARMSQYLASRSRQALDEAVLNGRLAKRGGASSRN